MDGGAITVRNGGSGSQIERLKDDARRARYVPDRERSLQLQTHFNRSRTPDSYGFSPIHAGLCRSGSVGVAGSDATFIQPSVDLTTANALEGGESLLVSERKRV